MKKLLIAVLLSGCTEYTNDITLLKEMYCTKNIPADMKKKIIGAIRYKVPGYPIHGICGKPDSGNDHGSEWMKF